MNDVLLGMWIRRFLLEHLISERNLSRKTQQSYRDTFCLLIPFVSKDIRKPNDRLLVEDISGDCVRKFLGHLETERHCSVRTRSWLERNTVAGGREMCTNFAPGNNARRRSTRAV